MLHSIDEVRNRIEAGEPLFLAGSEPALLALPRGKWIGGTIPYFMDAEGGVCSESKVFVSRVPECAAGVRIVEYALEALPSICSDAPDNGFSFLILPAQSAVHAAYAQDAPGYDGAFLKPVVGWVAGVHVSQIGKLSAKVFNGTTGESNSQRAVVMHVTLPPDKAAEIDIVNVFEPGPGDAISFPVSGFSATRCLVNGQERDFVDYVAQLKPDPHAPLTADYNGSIVNVSLQGVDPAGGAMRFYAPVFEGVEYRFAAPVADYVAAFNTAVESHEHEPAAFSCNCILNYLYASLEGKHTGTLTGPITFGEVAHQLLNQTLVRLSIRDTGAL